MRLVGFVLAAVAFVHQAHAADPGGVLRGGMFELGSPRYFPWSGVYGGGHWGYSSAAFETTDTTSELIAFILRDTIIENEAQVSQLTTLPNTGTTATTYGAFVGYNVQWDSVVLGFELNYNRGKIDTTAADALGRSFQTSDGYFYNIDLSANAKVEVKDFATIRARAGYAAGRFLPYGMFAFAVGRVDKSSSATVDLTAEDISGAGRPPLALLETRTEARKDVFTFGWAAGGGVDIALLQNLFVRGEFEHLQFTTNGVAVAINTVRAGAGVKF
jgi:outer membrane immunogenic protein